MLILRVGTTPFVVGSADQILRKHGINSECAVSGREALEFLPLYDYVVLQLLFLRQGTVLIKGAFLTHLYCGTEEPEMKTIDVLICRLRKKLAVAGVPTLIDTVWGCGYILRDPSIAVADVVQDNT